MRRGSNGIRLIVNTDDDGLEKEKVPQDLIGVLSKALVERLKVLAKRRIECLIRRNEREQSLTGLGVNGDGQGLDGKRPHPRKDWRTRFVVGGEASSEGRTRIVAGEMGEEVSDGVSLPAGKQVLLS